VDELQQIFRLNIASNTITQLTFVGNNVQPLYSAADSSIYFASDRGGQPSPYRMAMDGSDQVDLAWSASARQVQIHMFSLNGQSNTVAAEGFPGIDGYPATYLDSTQPYVNLKLLDSSGNYTDSNAATLSLVPLTEPLRTPTGGVYPANIGGAGLAGAIANQLSFMLGAGHVSFVSSVGQGGTGIDLWGADGSGNCYQAEDFEARALKRLADAQSKSSEFNGSIIIAGENDAYRPVADFKADLIKLANRLQSDRKPVFGQTRPIPMLLTQQHAFATDYRTPASTQAQFEVAIEHPLIYLAEPGYQHRYAPAGGGATGVHLNGWAHRRRGVKLAQALKAIYYDGQEWTGLRPNKIEWVPAANKIIISMDVPYAPLRFDPQLHQPALINGSANPWLNGKGFEVATADGSPIQILSAAIVGRTVELVLPGGSSPKIVRYAMTAGAQSGGYLWASRENPNSRRGQLCDSDPLQGYDKQDLTCNVTNGSSTVTIGASGFVGRGWYDRVNGSGLAPGSTVINRVSDTQLTLSSPWSGATGTTLLSFWADQSNYCAAFELPINWRIA
ncbi:MAG: hypothetical protein ACRC2U_09445, partial [Aeromonas sp.]